MAWRKVPLQAAAVFTQATGTHSEQDLCLVYLADVLPEQMGKGNESLSHFCLAVHPCSSIIFSLKVTGWQTPA